MTLPEALGLLLSLSMLAVLQLGSTSGAEWDEASKRRAYRALDIGPELQRRWLSRRN